MKEFTEFKNEVLSLLTKEFVNRNYDSLKNVTKEIIALAKKMNYKESYRGPKNACTVLNFYNDEDYTIFFYESDEYNWPYMIVTVRDKKKEFKVSAFK